MCNHGCPPFSTVSSWCCARKEQDRKELSAVANLSSPETLGIMAAFFPGGYEMIVAVGSCVSTR